MTLVNHPKFLEVSLQNGPKHSVIHVKNLSSNARVGVDVWGRNSGLRVNRLQPVQISASIAMKEPFVTAARSDSVDESTVHYGTLSKEIMKLLGTREERIVRPDAAHTNPNFRTDWTLTVLLDVICFWLTSQSFSLTYREQLYDEVYKLEDLIDKPWGYATLLHDDPACPKEAIVRMESIQELELTCFLPKGSILGSGVSLRVLLIPHPDPEMEEKPLTFCSILKLHDIRIPTLIGVNANERLAKQLVIANVEIDGYLLYDIDLYHKLEQIVVKTIEESSFETLETLGTHLINRITKWFIMAEYATFIQTMLKPHAPEFEQLITVSLEKPSAVIFADAPVVELRRYTDPKLDKTGMSNVMFEELWSIAERTGEDIDRVGQIPFPLQGRLDEWIRAKDPNDTT